MAMGSKPAFSVYTNPEFKLNIIKGFEPQPDKDAVVREVGFAIDCSGSMSLLEMADAIDGVVRGIQFAPILSEDFPKMCRGPIGVAVVVFNKYSRQIGYMALYDEKDAERAADFLSATLAPIRPSSDTSPPVGLETLRWMFANSPFRDEPALERRAVVIGDEDQNVESPYLDIVSEVRALAEMEGVVTNGVGLEPGIYNDLSTPSNSYVFKDRSVPGGKVVIASGVDEIAAAVLDVLDIRHCMFANQKRDFGLVRSRRGLFLPG